MTLTELKDAIKELPVSQIVGLYLPLKRQGQDHKAHCPWHQDSNPSLTVNDHKGLFRCWVCDIGGDGITFVEKLRNLPFKEALLELGERLGFDVDQARAPHPVQDPRLQLALKINKVASQLYFKHGSTQKYQAYNDFLKERALDASIAERFQIGYAPPHNTLVSYLQSLKEPERGPALAMALELKLIREGYQGGHFDTFRERIVFPIWDQRGKVVGFSSRKTRPEQKAKYINSQESFVFHKKKILYGLNFARNFIRERQYALLVEGQMDCIAMHKNGFEQTVAISGTAISDYVIQSLQSLTKEVVLLLDGDQAGQLAAQRMAPMFLERGFKLRYGLFQEVKDPDEFLNKNGKLAMHEWIERAPLYIDHQIDHTLPAQRPQSTEAKLGFLHQCFAILRPLGDTLLCREKAIDTAKRLGLQSDKQDIVQAYLDYLKDSPPASVEKSVTYEKMTPSPAPAASSAPTTPSLALNKAESNFLGQLLQNPWLLQCTELSETLDFIEHPEVKRLIVQFIELYFEIEESEFEKMAMDIVNQYDHDELRSFVGAKLYNSRPRKLEDSVKARLFQDLTTKLQLDYLKHQRDQLRSEQKSIDDIERQRVILGELVGIEKRMQEIKNHRSTL